MLQTSNLTEDKRLSLKFKVIRLLFKSPLFLCRDIFADHNSLINTYSPLQSSHLPHFSNNLPSVVPQIWLRNAVRWQSRCYYPFLARPKWHQEQIPEQELGWVAILALPLSHILHPMWLSQSLSGSSGRIQTWSFKLPSTFYC